MDIAEPVPDITATLLFSKKNCDSVKVTKGVIIFAVPKGV